MKKKGVIGAGVMGVGVAQVLAESGYSVILIDNSDEKLNVAREKIFNNCRFKYFMKSKEELEQPDIILSRIEFTNDYTKLEDCDFIIENVPEKIEIKREVYKNLDEICNEECIFMANTSCTPITKIASFTQRSAKVIGAHFMNPVHIKNIVEVITGYHTSCETIQATKELINSMGKKSIIVNDSPGFVINRVSHILMNEAAFLVQENVASPEDIDELFKECLGHKMGPLETADLIGLDTVVNSLNVLYESYQDSKFRCCPLLKKLVDAGLLGNKAGEGFYKHY